MGLSYFHPSLQKNKRFYFHNRLASGQSLLINTVFELDDKWFLIGTDTKGLFLFDSQNDELKAIPSPATQISSIRKTPIGVLIGSNNGTFLWDESKKKVIHKAILTQRTLNIRVLNKCYTAICTNVGLCILDQKGKVFRIEEKNTLSEKLMCKDALLIDNQLWILRFFDGWEVRSFDSNELKFHSRLIDLDFPIDYHGISASKDAVFIASSAGLIRQEIKNINHLKHYKTQDGLIGDRIENILIGRRNELYYTTIDGLYQFNDDLKKSHRLVSYENYIQKWYNQLDFGNNHSLVYTVSDNFCVFYTKDNYFNEKTPNLKPEAIWVNSQPWNLNKELRLPHLSNNIRIQFGACVYPESSKNRWIYRLVGKKSPKPHWKESSGEITLQYLPPDEYVLEYFSRNNEGKQSLHIEKLAITITSPFYATYWFFILILVLVIALFLLLYSYKQYQNKRLIRIRNQISRDLHDELGANVSSIHIMANLLQQRPNSPQATTALKNISRYSVQISDTINDIIWNVNPQFDSMDELIKRMTRFASETIESAQIDYDIVVPEVIPMMKLDNQTKYHLYLLFKECINNAVKHAKSNCIQILFEFAGKRFFFSVEDNGVGFEIEKKANGNGLANIQHRANEINATLTIETSLEKGTKINLSIQLS
jgi:signal transduction histidine kinase